MGSSARFFRSPDKLRAWFEAHHADERELWVGFHKAHTGRVGVDYVAAVEEALCFGWIDTTVRRLDEDRYAHRFSPRRRGSQWSAVNRERFARLLREGRMAPAGRRAFAERTEDRSTSDARRPSDLAPDQLARLRADPNAWGYYSRQPPSYRRLAAYWVLSAVRPETRERRLRGLVVASAADTRPRAFQVAREDRTAPSEARARAKKGVRTAPARRRRRGGSGALK